MRGGGDIEPVRLMCPHRLGQGLVAKSQIFLI